MADTKYTLDKLQPHFSQIAGDLWAQHRDDIAALITDSPDNTVKIAFSAKIDLSEHQPRMKVGISFSKPYSDVISFELDDPDQLPLLEPEPSIEPSRNGRSVAITLPEPRNGHDALGMMLNGTSAESGNAQPTDDSQSAKRGRGRPPGARNKPKANDVAVGQLEHHGEQVTDTPENDAGETEE